MLTKLALCTYEINSLSVQLRGSKSIFSRAINCVIYAIVNVMFYDKKTHGYANYIFQASDTRATQSRVSAFTSKYLLKDILFYSEQLRLTCSINMIKIII